MVIFFEWHRTAVDQKSSSGLPMTGEDTGLGALASPLVGYLGKVQDRAGSLEYCPWCTSKGSTYALCSYRINLQESITLCTNPQCLFPLVSQSLEDVLASLDPAEPTVGSKRKNAVALEKEGLIKRGHKRPRSSALDSPGQHSITDSLVGQAECCAVNVVHNGQQAAPEADTEKANGYHRESPVAEATGWESPQVEGDVVDQEPENGFPLPASTASADWDAPPLSPHHGGLGKSEAEEDLRQVKNPLEAPNRRCSLLDSNRSLFPNEDIHSTELNTPSPRHNEQTAGTEQKSQTADITTPRDVKHIEPKTEGSSSATRTESEELAPVPNQLFWRNSSNLCWLDSLLVALVNCKSLRKCKPEGEPPRSSVWRLLRGYEDVCAAIQDQQRTGTDGVVRVPHHALQKANADLQGLRMSIFKLLQPKLHCKLGQRDTPVFAMPLLLMMDSWAEPLFQLTFHWEFKCSECNTATKERVMKTLPTFTNIWPDWRPLRATHSAPCNVCRKNNQRRSMILESVPPVFELHFVEGLPDNDVRVYTFTFKGKRYSVTTVIQYNQQLKHFVTWVRRSDGSWLEYDDLKHPDCRTHQKLPVPAQEMHIVFWEAEEDKEPRVCSPSSTFAESPPSKNEANTSLADKDLEADELLACSPDQSLLTAHNDTDIISALATTEGGSGVMDATVTVAVDTSIGSTTLLDTFEGLTPNDIITLTLVELKADSEMPPSDGNGQTQDFRAPSSNEILDSTPDSSSAVTGSGMSHGPDVELLNTSNSSESESGSSSDPTFVPGARGGRGRSRGKGKAVSRQQRKNAASSKAAARVSPPASSGASSKVVANTPGVPAAQDSTLPVVEATPRALPASSTDASPLSTSRKSPMMPPVLDQNARWSFLLSKHPLHPVHSPVPKVPPVPHVAQVKPTPPTHSTPNPVRRQQLPKLKTEQSDNLPPKAAEMYGAFGAKISSTPSPLPSPALLQDKSKQFKPIICNQQKSLTNITVVSATPLPTPAAKRLPEISSSKKHSRQSSKVPPGLSDTEALRYKLRRQLKAKRKRLAQLNEMLGHQGGASLRPDSTALGSPATVTSSTYDGSICDDFLSDLLSPATTASNLSPDSTGFLEMLANGQDGVNQSECRAVGAASQVNACMSEPITENFLDDFLSQAVAQQPTDMETEALNALEIFF